VRYCSGRTTCFCLVSRPLLDVSLESSIVAVFRDRSGSIENGSEEGEDTDIREKFPRCAADCVTEACKPWHDRVFVETRTDLLANWLTLSDSRTLV
jgi:hypothetical protein